MWMCVGPFPPGGHCRRRKNCLGCIQGSPAPTALVFGELSRFCLDPTVPTRIIQFGGLMAMAQGGHEAPAPGVCQPLLALSASAHQCLARFSSLNGV